MTVEHCEPSCSSSRQSEKTISYELCDKVQEVIVDATERNGNIEFVPSNSMLGNLPAENLADLLIYCFGKPMHQLFGIGPIGGSGVNSKLERVERRLLYVQLRFLLYGISLLYGYDYLRQLKRCILITPGLCHLTRLFYSQL